VAALVEADPDALFFGVIPFLGEEAFGVLTFLEATLLFFLESQPLGFS